MSMNKELNNAAVIPAAFAALLGNVGASMAANPAYTSGGKDVRPNVILLYIDDMGLSDISAYGGQFTPTPNIDRIGKEGIIFSQYYTSCPISSPSRVGVTTGMYPTKWGITTFLNDRRSNRRNESNDYLLAEAPTLAKALKKDGYATGHFGKWHMGGGRDVKDMPQITDYGFDEYASTWESPDPDPAITASDWIWSDRDSVKRWDRTAYFVDKTLDFLARHKGEPCYVNLWPDDMHTPYVPSQKEYDNGVASGKQNAYWEKEFNFIPVLIELDRQIGRLLTGLDELGIAAKTIVIFTSDNGPNPSYKNRRTAGLRGQKATLYEGGIRMPFMIRWPSVIKPGQRNDKDILCSVDIFPTICAIAGDKHPDTNGYQLDGVDFSRLLHGKTMKRREALYWEFGKHFVGKDLPRNAYQTRSPNVCVREGDWKLLVNYDGTCVELYNLKDDVMETQNVAGDNPEIAKRMTKMAIDWFKSSFRKHAGKLSPVGDKVAVTSEQELAEEFILG